jgi:DNA anti-recombination protein RmuC
MLRETVALIADLPQNVRATTGQAIDSASDLLRSVGRIEDELRAIGGTVGSAGEDIHELRASGNRQEARLERIEDALGELKGRFATIETLVTGLARDVGDVTERLPDREKGALAKAREALTGESADDRR